MIPEDDEKFYWVFTSAYSPDDELEWHCEGWIYFAQAVEEIRSRLGMSLGFAEVKLRQLCASGNVRSMKYDNVDQVEMEYPPEPELIKPSEWVHDQIDHSVPSHITLTVSRDDLQYWLNQQALERQGKPARSPHKRDLAQQAVDAIWRDGIPKDLLAKQIEKQVGEWLKAKGLPAISRDTILRAAGRK